ncbi:MAG: BBP7 family outer membrane beta-barrel protein, partial [Patescibacteria group bacterium]|nr:BBP7 family outer membrane beta-barrel protein [Patescibacteria group bacterium]
STLPPLVTTSTPGTEPSESGVLGLPGTSILFGNGSVNTSANSGWRITLGYWLDDCQSVGIEAGYLGFGEEAARFFASSEETPILARPFYDTQLSLESAMPVAHPDYWEGWIRCDVTSRFQAVEVLLRRNLFRQSCRRVDSLIGWRFAGLDETVRIDHFSRWTRQQGPVEVGTTKSFHDLFDAQNRFNGVTLGVAYRERVGRWSLEAVMKLGLGSTRSRVLIDGATTTTVPGDEEIDTIRGALLAQDTNMGRHSRNQFAVLPELGFTLGCDLTPRLHATFGYTFLYWSQVARPANQIDTNASQLPDEPPTGSRQPAFAFTMSDYWAQGMNFGLEYRF